jgi:hypothetical protein
MSVDYQAAWVPFAHRAQLPVNSRRTQDPTKVGPQPCSCWSKTIPQCGRLKASVEVFAVLTSNYVSSLGRGARIG